MLPRSFFQHGALELAQSLLGCELVHRHAKGVTAGIIVETEAYRQDDAASHSFRGMTKRNEVMFGEAGRAYIYFTYGMHHCFNVVGGTGKMAEAVLIRALEPTRGSELMEERRKTTDPYNLCSGPAKLVQAMGITQSQNGADLTKGDLFLRARPAEWKAQIQTSSRIGITQAADRPWRYFVGDSQYVTRHRLNTVGDLA
jgi:DNA-3-methyladenine glycosylase